MKVGRPIRVTAIVGASEYVRFTGYVNDWPVEWPGDSTTYAKATITASSRLSRLGLQAPLQPLVDHVVRSQPSLVAYFPLTDPEGSTVAAETSGNAGPNAEKQAGGGTTLPTFGTTDGGFDDRAYMIVGPGTATMVSGPWDPAPVNIAVSAFFKTPGPAPAAELQTVARYRSVGLYIDPSGQVTGNDGGAVFLSSATVVSDNAWHHAALTYDGVTYRLYVDGVEEDSSAGGAIPYGTTQASIGDLWADTVHSISIGRFAVHGAALTADEVAMISEAGHTAFSGDTTDERLQRYATWGRIPAAEVTTTASPVTLTAAQATEVQVESLMRQVETAEAGVLYDDRSGNLVLKPRSARYSAPVALTVPFSEDRVSGYQPKVDRQGLANVGTGKSSSGAEVTYTNEASREEYGDHEYSVETTALDPGEPLQLAAWQVNRNAEPRPRVPAPSLSVIDWLDSADLTALLGLDIGSLLRLTGAPSQAPNATSADYFVEGYSEEIGVGTWTLSPNLTPVTLEDDVLILDSATDGVLDSMVLGL